MAPAQPQHGKRSPTELAKVNRLKGHLTKGAGLETWTAPQRDCPRSFRQDGGRKRAHLKLRSTFLLEDVLRPFWLLPLLLLAGCYYPYGPYPYYPYYGYSAYPPPAYPYGYAPSYGAPPPAYGNPPGSPGAQQPYYGSAQPSYNPAANDPNNCGTPDEPKPCYRRYR